MNKNLKGRNEENVSYIDSRIMLQLNEENE